MLKMFGFLVLLLPIAIITTVVFESAEAGATVAGTGAALAGAVVARRMVRRMDPPPSKARQITSIVVSVIGVLAVAVYLSTR